MAQRAFRIISHSFAGKRLRCRYDVALLLFSSYLRLSPFIPILILSSGEKIDLSIMGNWYERERATTQGVVCTSAATSQTRVRINRGTQPPTRRLT